MSGLRYSVLLKRPEQLKTAELAKALAGLRKAPVQDMIHQARGCWGIIEEDQEEASARALAEGLEARALSALAVPSSLIHDLAPASAASAADWTSLNWSRVILIAAAALKKTESKTVIVKEGPDLGRKALGMGLMLVTGIPINIAGKEKNVIKTVETSELFCYMDLILKDPDSRLRIDAQDFDYSVLKEKKVYNVFGNFKLLLAQAAELAPAAQRGRGSAMLLANLPTRDMGYESLKDLERESRWLLTLRELKLA